MELVRGRAIHPVNVRVGGFYRAPARTDMASLAEKLRVGLDLALDTVAWAAGFEFPDFHHSSDPLYVHVIMGIALSGPVVVVGGDQRPSPGTRYDVWTAIRICPVMASTSMPRSSQRVTGFADRAPRDLRGTPNICGWAFRIAQH
jgi:hypothetical protein